MTSIRGSSLSLTVNYRARPGNRQHRVDSNDCIVGYRCISRVSTIIIVESKAIAVEVEKRRRNVYQYMHARVVFFFFFFCMFNEQKYSCPQWLPRWTRFPSYI